MHKNLRPLRPSLVRAPIGYWPSAIGYLRALATLLSLLLLATAALATSPADQKLLQAVQQANLPLLQAALTEGANPNCRDTNALPPLLLLLRNATAPLDAAQRHCAACLLEHGAAVDATDPDRRTPLIYAARLGDLDTVRLLVEAGAFVMARDRFHKSALFYAVEAHRRDLVLYLAANGDLLSPSVKERKAHQPAREGKPPREP